MRPMSTDKADSKFGHLSVNLEIATSQQDPASGLSLEIHLKNQGATSMTLFRPNDGAQVQILDAKGAPVMIDKKIPESLIHRVQTPEAQGGPIELQPGQEFQVHLNFKQMSKMTTASDGSKTEKILPLEPGTYEVKAQITVISTQKDNSGAFESATYIADPLKVKFGPVS